MAWPRVDDLPDNTVPYTAAGVELYRSGVGIGLHGWVELASTR